MSVLVVEPPARLVSLEDMKAHLRVTVDDEDALIGAYIDAACGWLDGPDGWLGRCIGSQVLEVFYGPGRGAMPFLREPDLTVPIGPVLDVLAVEYWDRDGVATELELQGIEVRRDLIDWGAAADWLGRTNRVRLRYRAGYAETPAPVAQAIKLLVGQWFRNRSGINIGNIVNQLPNGVKALLGPYHRRRV
jgi:Phage gp6-like head-tail connector protein